MGVGMNVRYTYRLRVNATQVDLLQQVFDVDRAVWNLALGRWSDLWRKEDHTKYSFAEACKELADWRQTYEWMAAQPSICQQQTIRDLFRSISAFFDGPTQLGVRCSSPVRKVTPLPVGRSRALPLKGTVWRSLQALDAFR